MVLLVALVPVVICMFLLGMEWLEFTLLDSRAQGSDDAVSAGRSSAAGTSSTRESAATPVIDDDSWLPAATRRRQAIAG